MKEKTRADRGPSPPTDESHEVESWLREAVRAPHAARVPSPGDVVGGKYQIEELLGRGGMGVVFRAHHLISEKPVAIKWMLQPATDEQARRRFEREARAAGRIDHPNVVGLYDLGEEGECSYLVMELLRGESLRTRLGRGPIEPHEAVDMLIPAMRGVAAAHRAGVIHRDLKPDNIFLCEESEGSPPKAKVLDFGISSIASKETADSRLTQEGTLLGSLAYMSPEQIGNPHAVDARTDVYAFGVILYEVLTGGLPFRASSHGALAIAIATSQPKRPSQIQPALTQDLEEVVLRALARDRADRHPDMKSLITALLPFATTARPSSEPRASTDPAVSATGSGSHTTLGSERHSTQPDSDGDGVPTDRRPRAARGRLVLAVASLLAIAAVWWLASAWRSPEPPLSARTSPAAAAAASGKSVAAPDDPAPQAEAPRDREADRSAPAPTTPAQSAASETPAKSVRPRSTKSIAPPRSRSAAAKTEGEQNENVLFSGRK